MKYLVVLSLAISVAACSGSPSASVVPGHTDAQQTAVRAASTPSGFLGCPYPSGDVWQTNVTSKAMVNTSSANIKATVDGGGDGGFTAGVIVASPNNVTNEYINMASGSTPMVVVHPKVAYHTPKSPEPWVFNPAFYIEPIANAHAMVLQSDACQYYETYKTTAKKNLHRLSAYSGTYVDLTQAFVRPDRGACSTSSCIPIGLLAVRPEELAAGAIAHALGWNAVTRSVSKTACVSPAAVANCTDGRGYKGPKGERAKAMPAGAHIRLKASFDISGFHPEAKIVAAALQQYGAYLYDTGSQNLIPFVNDVHGAPMWTSDDERDLETINIGNFDVVDAP
ncbi:MAG TPA: hypothetical protein VGF86_13370 [Candidatus Tumulicola sp.]